MALRLFSTMGVSASALTAERFKMDLASNNIANYNTIGYRSRFATQAERSSDFTQMMQNQGAFGENKLPDQQRLEAQLGEGVRITDVRQDQSEFRLKLDPGHPDADAQGYVRLSNVDLLTEVTNMLMAQRAYEANVTAMNATKQLTLKSLEIGR